VRVRGRIVGGSRDLESEWAMPDVSENDNAVVVGVRFHKVGKVYHFSADGIDGLREGDFVIVETVQGCEMGQVVQTNVQPRHNGPPLKPVRRLTTARDMVLRQQFKLQEKQSLITCRQKAKELHLPIHIVKVEYSYDGRRLTVFFVADDKVDYRLLQQALARHFRIKIAMHSVGSRDFAKMMGGCGACGGSLCCSTFLTEFAPVSIKAAKAQDVPLLPLEITGMCGRLRCCLRYEYQTYQEVRQTMPQRGHQVVTDLGTGRVVQTNVLKRTVVVDLGTHQAEIPLDELRVKPKGRKSVPRKKGTGGG